MPDLRFQVDAIAPIPYAAVPTLGVTLRIRNEADEAIEAVSLQCQVRIEAGRRRYSPGEKDGLLDLFGTPDRWAQTLKTFLWTHAAVNVRPFERETVAELPVPCTFDFEVVATKYLHALEDGEVPLLLLFSGSIFYRDEDGELQVTQIPWEQEASVRLPITVWKTMMDFYYPSSAWVVMHRDIFERLLRFKTEQGIPTWDRALERLLDAAAQRTPA